MRTVITGISSSFARIAEIVSMFMSASFVMSAWIVLVVIIATIRKNVEIRTIWTFVLIALGAITALDVRD